MNEIVLMRFGENEDDSLGANKLFQLAKELESQCFEVCGIWQDENYDEIGINLKKREDFIGICYSQKNKEIMLSTEMSIFQMSNLLECLCQNFL